MFSRDLLIVNTLADSTCLLPHPHVHIPHYKHETVVAAFFYLYIMAEIHALSTNTRFYTIFFRFYQPPPTYKPPPLLRTRDGGAVFFNLNIMVEIHILVQTQDGGAVSFIYAHILYVFSFIFIYDVFFLLTYTLFFRFYQPPPTYGPPPSLQTRDGGAVFFYLYIMAEIHASLQTRDGEAIYFYIHPYTVRVFFYIHISCFNMRRWGPSSFISILWQKFTFATNARRWALFFLYMRIYVFSFIPK